MSALLAALQRLEGRALTAPAPITPTVAPKAAFAMEPVSSSHPSHEFTEPLRSAGWDEVSLPAEVVAPAEAEAEAVVAVAEPEDAAAALAHILHSPALAAVVAVGVTGDFLPLLRGFGESLSARTMTDVVLLGPGMLDDAVGLAAQWKVLCSHVGYGLVHAPAERATLRLDALKQTSGVIALVELGRTPVAAVKSLRTLLAERDIPLLGTLAIRDEVA